MIQYQLTKTEDELQQILELQQRNLAKNLTEKERKIQGFVTVQHSFLSLKKLHNINPHIIAKHNNKIIGYALSMDVSCKEEVEILKPMFNKIDAVFNDSYIIMGQICIDKSFRGKGVFKELYLFMKTIFYSKFNAIITEIDVKNTRSIKAHQKVGFKKLSRYFLNNQEWEIVILKINTQKFHPLD